jgi:DNA-binding MarR family transcriptional regulator
MRSHPTSITTLPLRDFQALAGFRRTLRTFLRFSEQAARDAGLTPSQHQLLLMVKGFDEGQPSVGDAAEWLGLRHHSAVELVDRAVSAGLLQREADPADARRQLLRLSGLGEAKLTALSAVHRDELRRFRTEVLAELDKLG